MRIRRKVEAAATAVEAAEAAVSEAAAAETAEAAAAAALGEGRGWLWRSDGQKKGAKNHHQYQQPQQQQPKQRGQKTQQRRVTRRMRRELAAAAARAAARASELTAAAAAAVAAAKAAGAIEVPRPFNEAGRAAVGAGAGAGAGVGAGGRLGGFAVRRRQAAKAASARRGDGQQGVEQQLRVPALGVVDVAVRSVVTFGQPKLTNFAGGRSGAFSGLPLLRVTTEDDVSTQVRRSKQSSEPACMESFLYRSLTHL